MSKMAKLKQAMGLRVAAIDGAEVLPTMVEAEAAITVAEKASAAASSSVTHALASWPAGSQDRRWVEGQSWYTEALAFSDQRNLSPKQKAFLEATRAEKAAYGDLDRARKTLDKMRRAERLSGGRAILREAIKEASATSAASKDGDAAVVRARQSLNSAEELVTRTAVALADAKQAYAQRLAAAVGSGEAILPDATMRAARHEHQEAEEIVEMTRAALNAIANEAEEPKRIASRAAEKVEKAAKLVLVAELDDLQADVMEAGRAYFERAQVFAFVQKQIDFFDSDHQERNGRDWFARRHGSVPDIADTEAVGQAVVGPWAAALAALHTDADFPLPNERA